MALHSPSLYSPRDIAERRCVGWLLICFLVTLDFYTAVVYTLPILDVSDWGLRLDNIGGQHIYTIPVRVLDLILPVRQVDGHMTRSFGHRDPI